MACVGWCMELMVEQAGYRTLDEFCDFHTVGCSDTDLASGSYLQRESSTTVRVVVQVLAVITINRHRPPSKQVTCKLFVTTANYEIDDRYLKMPASLQPTVIQHYGALRRDVVARLQQVEWRQKTARAQRLLDEP